MPPAVCPREAPLVWPFQAGFYNWMRIPILGTERRFTVVATNELIIPTPHSDQHISKSWPRSFPLHQKIKKKKNSVFHLGVFILFHILKQGWGWLQAEQLKEKQELKISSGGYNRFLRNESCRWPVGAMSLWNSETSSLMTPAALLPLPLQGHLGLLRPLQQLDIYQISKLYVLILIII